MRHKEFWIALGVGAAVGGVAALLYAPQSGTAKRVRPNRQGSCNHHKRRIASLHDGTMQGSNTRVGTFVPAIHRSAYLAAWGAAP